MFLFPHTIILFTCDIDLFTSRISLISCNTILLVRINLINAELGNFEVWKFLVTSEGIFDEGIRGRR